MLMNIGHENFTLLVFGKCVRQVHTRTSMRGTVRVVSDGFNVIVHIRIEMLTTLPVIYPARDHVPQMRDHTGGDQHLPFRVKVDTPRVTKTVSDHFKCFFGGMKTPDS